MRREAKQPLVSSKVHQSHGGNEVYNTREEVNEEEKVTWVEGTQ